MTIEIEAVKKLLPRHQRTMVNQEFLDKIEASIEDPLVAEQFKDNFISYLGVLQTGKYKIEDYINAVKYVGYKLMNMSNIKAYAATFPDRYQRLVKENPTQIDAYVAMYNKNKLVNQIWEQTIVPSYVLNASYHQEAINVLVDIIQNPNIGGMTKVKACATLLEATKKPDVIKGELNINVDQQNTIGELRDVTEKLAETLKQGLEKGHKKLKEIAEESILDVEYREL